MSVSAPSGVSYTPPASYMRLAELLMGSRIALALHVVAQKEIADLLGEEALLPEELSSLTCIPSQGLGRLLRALVDLGVFREDNEGRFANNEVSNHLRSTAPFSLRDMTIVLNDDAVVRGWLQLNLVLQTGTPAFASVNGSTFFEHLALDQKRSEAMARFMESTYGAEGPKIALSFPFDRFERLIDIGGGAGNILADILEVHPGLQGAVFELPTTADAAKRHLQQRGLAHRAKVFVGNFLQTVASGYDAYLIKSTLHDFDDDQSVQILCNIRDAMPPHGRLLVAEILFDPGKPVPHPHRFIDLEMMVTFGGRERSTKEYAELLHCAGLRIKEVHTISDSVFSLIEALQA